MRGEGVRAEGRRGARAYLIFKRQTVDFHLVLEERVFDGLLGVRSDVREEPTVFAHVAGRVEGQEFRPFLQTDKHVDRQTDRQTDRQIKEIQLNGKNKQIDK